MNLKFYLRGLGIGIVVAAILMGVATRGNEPMTDAEIKERAAQLGMVEQKVLADISEANEKNSAEMVTQSPRDEVTDVPTETPQSETTAAPTQAPQGEETAAPTQAPQVEATAAPTQAPQVEATAVPTQMPQDEDVFEKVVLIIRSGESSWTVSQNLASLGLVEDAVAFDRFLSQGGYDKSIRTGEFEIVQGATFDEIAKIIAR